MSESSKWRELAAMWAQGHSEDFLLDLWIELRYNLVVGTKDIFQLRPYSHWVSGFMRREFLCEFLFFFIQLYDILWYDLSMTHQGSCAIFWMGIKTARKSSTVHTVHTEKRRLREQCTRRDIISQFYFLPVLQSLFFSRSLESARRPLFHG